MAYNSRRSGTAPQINGAFADRLGLASGARLEDARP